LYEWYLFLYGHLVLAGSICYSSASWSHQIKAQQYNPCSKRTQISDFLYEKQRQSDCNLNSFKHAAASVLPVITINGEEYVMLSRESRGKDRGQWDDFGGKANYGETPIQTAAREGYEELNSEFIFGMNKKQFADYIHQNNNNTEQIVAQEAAGTFWGGCNYVAYLTRFSEDIVKKYGEKFAELTDTHKNKHANKSCFLEKDAIALVKWDYLMKAIAHHEHVVDAHIIAWIPWNKLKAAMRKTTSKNLLKKDCNSSGSVIKNPKKLPPLAIGKIIPITLRGIFIAKLFNFCKKNTNYSTDASGKIFLYRK